MPDISIEDALAHYGVKGMKWGVRRDEAVLRRLSGSKRRAPEGETRAERKASRAADKKAWKDYKKSTTSKERRADKQEALRTKTQYIVEQVAKDNKALVSTLKLGDQYPTLMTGKEFVDGISNGAWFAPAYTEISEWRLGDG